MGFSITFQDEPPCYPYDDASTPAASGVLVFGEFQESFLASLYQMEPGRLREAMATSDCRSSAWKEICAYNRVCQPAGGQPPRMVADVLSGGQSFLSKPSAFLQPIE